MLRFLPTLASDLLPAVALVGWVWLRRSGPLPLDGAEWRLARFADSPRRAIFAAAAVTFLVAVIVSAVRPAEPAVHDEFSYLLAADTFASGRLTNPAHPLTRFFASPHVLLEPTYQSKYPPAQGLALAVGELLGSPLAGVWLSMAALSAAVCWALAAFVPMRWAFLAGLAPAVRFGYFAWDAELSWGYWSASYWGGAVPAAGGALLLGAAERLIEKPRVSASLLLGVGLAVLATSRPYEGLVAAAVVCGRLAYRLVKRPGRVLPALVPAGLVVALALAGLAAYNHAVTGDPLTMPHTLYSHQHQSVGHFVFSPPHAPEVPPAGRLGRFHRDFGRERLAAKPGWGLPHSAPPLLTAFFLGAALVIPFAASAAAFGSAGVSAGVGSSAALCAAVLAAHVPTTTGNVHPHYFAPATAALLLLVVQGLRKTRGAGAVGVALSRGLVLGCVLTFVVSAAMRFAAAPPDPGRFPWARVEVEKHLEADPAPDLVIVRYSQRYPTGAEWVYNAASIDGAPVVWAHDLGDEENEALLDYFSDRKVWILEPHLRPPKLTAVR